MSAVLAGFAASLSLIVAIGAQNAFVLRQGLARRHVLAVCAFCAAADAALITVGVFGLATATAMAPWLERALTLGGIVFLLAYGARSAWSAWRGGSRLDPAGASTQSLRAALGTAAALTFLNPHVYLDTVVLLGAVSQGWPKLAFWAGAVTASATFFFSLGFGARWLAPLFARPAAWRVLDAAMAGLMVMLAAGLAARLQ